MRLTIIVPYQTKLLLESVKKQYPLSPHLHNTLVAAALQRGLREFQLDPKALSEERDVQLIPLRLTSIPQNEVEPERE